MSILCFERRILHKKTRELRKRFHIKEKEEKERKKRWDRKKSFHTVPWDLNNGHKKWSVETQEVAWGPLVILGHNNVSIPYLSSRYGKFPIGQKNCEFLQRFKERKPTCMRFLVRPINCEQCVYHFQDNSHTPIAQYQHLTGAPICPFTKPDRKEEDN